MKQLVLIILFLFTSLCSAQKRMTKSISTENIKSTTLKLDNVYSIDVKSHNKPEILLNVNVEGEHSEHVVITSKKMFGSLLISTSFQPAFKNANDKLSAHKVISVQVDVTLPEQIIAYIKSDIAKVKALGTYKNLTIELSNGNCELTDFKGHAMINTQEGDILVKANYAQVDAKSSNASVVVGDLDFGPNNLKLKSVNGIIRVIKSQ